MKSWMLNTKGDDDENFGGVAPLYIRLRQHPDFRCVGAWIIKVASPILHVAMWGKQDIDVEHSVWTWILLEEEFMPYRFCGSQKWNVSVQYPFDC